MKSTNSVTRNSPLQVSISTDNAADSDNAEHSLVHVIKPVPPMKRTRAGAPTGAPGRDIEEETIAITHLLKSK